MKIAVVSDVHENFHNLIEVLKIIESEGCEVILWLWDYCNPGIIWAILSLNLKTYFVWGDNDGKKSKISQRVTLSENWDIADDTYRFLELDSLKIAMTHFSDLWKIIAKSGDFDLVFCWHTHKLFEEKIWSTLCINPGEVSTQRTWVCSFYIYDTLEKWWSFKYIENPLKTKSDTATEYLKSKWI